MSFYSPSGSCCVRPAVSTISFATAQRKKASPNIFADINQDVLVKLFENAGDVKAVERANIILTHYQDPEVITKQLVSLQHDKKHKWMFITELTRRAFTLR
ncbi:transcriptional and immune response regulator b [Misgurnus anguillicaudatus]|uniref:transcriptional and immune response regulator b n=1 Tax=Misgurnus anguillicaudatus TaxID=75329 RepID=UPI003CCF8C19